MDELSLGRAWRVLPGLLLWVGCAAESAPPVEGMPLVDPERPIHLEHCGSDDIFDVEQDIGPKDILNEAGDVPMPPKVIAWLDGLGWPLQHDAWHRVRRFDSACGRIDWSQVADRSVPQCPAAERMAEEGLTRYPIQEGAPGDGYEFLAMHRHMIDVARVAFYQHPDLFAGFDYVPFLKDDPENPIPGRDIQWSEAQKRVILTLENIEDHLDEFPTEDELGLFIQAPFRWTEANPTEFRDDDGGIHFALHAQWTVQGSDVNLADGVVTVYNRAFWELHGWIDNVWQRYRDAKGLSNDDPAYLEELDRQCHQMIDLQVAMDAAGGGPADVDPPPPGVFGDEVVPIFDARCAGCHGPTAPSAGLVLGPSNLVDAREVYSAIASVPATELPTMFLIEPGDSEVSYLFRKAAGTHESLDCPGGCQARMPPAGAPLTGEELGILQGWIDSGASLSDG